MWILLVIVAFFVLTGLAYVIITLLMIPGLAEERLGKLEDLPADAGQWSVDEQSPQATEAANEGLQRETRYWIDQDMLGRERILLQVRYIASDGRVIRTEPDVRVRRRRVKS